MINYDPEEYKEATSMELSIQHVHVCPTLLQDSPSPKDEALFYRHNHGPPKSQDACWVEASGSSLSAPPAVPMTGTLMISSQCLSKLQIEPPRQLTRPGQLLGRRYAYESEGSS